GHQADDCEERDEKIQESSHFQTSNLIAGLSPLGHPKGRTAAQALSGGSACSKRSRYLRALSIEHPALLVMLALDERMPALRRGARLILVTRWGSRACCRVPLGAGGRTARHIGNCHHVAHDDDGGGRHSALPPLVCQHRRRCY